MRHAAASTRCACMHEWLCQTAHIAGEHWVQFKLHKLCNFLQTKKGEIPDHWVFSISIVCTVIYFLVFHVSCGECKCKACDMDRRQGHHQDPTDLLLSSTVEAEEPAGGAPTARVSAQRTYSKMHSSRSTPAYVRVLWCNVASLAVRKQTYRIVC